MVVRVRARAWVRVRVKTYQPPEYTYAEGPALSVATPSSLYNPYRYLQRIGATASRLSFPYFYDPSFDAEMISIVPFLRGHWKERQEMLYQTRSLVSQERWDRKDPSQFNGKYGDYLLGKVSKAFPALSESVCII